MPEQKTSKDDASKIQSTQAKGGGDMSSRGFAARAQSAAVRNDAGQTSGQQSQGNQGSGDNKKE